MLKRKHFRRMIATVLTTGNASLRPNYVKLIPSGKSGYNTGADGVYVKFTY